MAQRKISSFFKRSSPPIPAAAAVDVSCKAGAPASSGLTEAIDGGGKLGSQTGNGNKKRSYAQFHLELGQTDFLFRNCSGCGFKYTPGDELDEKSHATFHKNYTLGVPFKGWPDERLVDVPSIEAGRVVLVLDNDPRPRKNKVREVIEMMENELGNGWIYHKLCKVYLYIASQRIAGCLVAEPIKEAFKVISHTEKQKPDNPVITKAERQEATLQFGNALLQRETVRRASPVAKNEVLNENLMGAIRCEEASVPAVCGIRAIWVTPSNRRKRVATHLLNAARKSFMEQHELDHCQLAFSEPTSAGRALASSYLRSTPLLVYRAL